MKYEPTLLPFPIAARLVRVDALAQRGAAAMKLNAKQEAARNMLRVALDQYRRTAPAAEAKDWEQARAYLEQLFALEDGNA